MQGREEIKKKQFQHRFCKNQHNIIRLDNIGFSKINEEDNKRLIRHFSEEKINQDLWECEGSQNSGLDGFNFNFIKKTMFCQDPCS